MSNVLVKSNIKDVAREALRALVIRKLDPSPDNYRRLFNEIAGTEEIGGSPSGAEDALARIANDFPRTSPELLRVAKAMERAAAKREWSHLAVLLQEAAQGLTRYYASAESWRALISELLQQFDVPHKGLSHGRKKERLERLLEIPATTPEHLQHKLAAIVRNWAELSNGADAADSHEPGLGQAAEIRRIAVPHHTDTLLDEPLMLCELLAHVLEIGMAGLLAYDPPMALEAEALAKQARGARSSPEVQAVRSATKSFLLRVELTTANTADLHQGMLRLLRLVVENVAALVGEDDWLHGQIAVLAEIVSRPLDLGMIHHAERRIASLMLRSA